MEVGNEGLMAVSEAHQKALQSIPIDRRFSLLDLIRGSGGANTPEGYSQEVLLVVAKEALTGKFVAWVGNLAKKGTLSMLGSLKKLRTLFVDELVFTDKGRASSDEETTGGASNKGGRGKRSGQELWTVEAGGKALRSNFSNNSILIVHGNGTCLWGRRKMRSSRHGLRLPH